MGHRHRVLVDRRGTAHPRKRLEPKLQGRNTQEIGRAVLETARGGGGNTGSEGARRALPVVSGLRDGLEHAAASIIHLVQDRGGGMANEQCADAGGETEHLVEGEDDKVGGVLGKVEIVGGSECGNVEENVPLAAAVEAILALDEVDPLLRVHLSRKVLFQRVCEEIVDLVTGGLFCTRSLALVLYVRAVNDVELGSVVKSEFSNSENRVVVFAQVVEMGIPCPGKRLADQMQTGYG